MAKSKNTNFSTMYFKKENKEIIGKLKVGKESYEDAIMRLVDRRDFDIINGQIVTKDTPV